MKLHWLVLSYNFPSSLETSSDVSWCSSIVSRNTAADVASSTPAKYIKTDQIRLLECFFFAVANLRSVNTKREEFRKCPQQSWRWPLLPHRLQSAHAKSAPEWSPHVIAEVDCDTVRTQFRADRKCWYFRFRYIRTSSCHFRWGMTLVSKCSHDQT